SVGSITSTRTPHQARRGIQDRPEDHDADMPLFAADIAHRDNPPLRRILCEDVPDAVRWLMESGVRFFGPMPEPPHRLPRMHTVLPNSLSFIHHLRRRAVRAGVDIRLGWRAAELLTDGGNVVGVACTGGKTVLATAGVVLAAGDFTNDLELKALHIGAQEAKVEGVNVTATGDGQKLALKLGARILNGDLALGPELRFIAPARTTLLRRLPPWPAVALAMQWSMDHLPQRILRPFIMSFLTTALAPSPDLFRQGALLVNREGARFCEEKDSPAIALPDQPDKTGFILVDGALAERFSAWPHFISTAPGVAYAYLPDYRRNRPDVFREGATVGELARKLGMPGEALASSFAAMPGARPPYIALGPVRSVFVHNEGGLAVDERHRVLDARDRPIPGLYAAGSTGQGGLLLKGHGHHLAWAFVSGRRAGRFAAGDRRA
ncbi:MAG: FAD-binding protein, partial [Betaproteobacteria bacterium]|nr:FAD-binding protein [Betaproteobacteria bacterium]